MSRLHMSSKSLPGVREDMDIPDGPGDDVRWEGTSIRSFCVSFIKIRLVLADLEMIWSCGWLGGGCGGGGGGLSKNLVKP